MTATLSTFRLGALWFGVDVSHVREVACSARVTPVPLAPANLAGLINVRGELTLVVDLRRVLQLPARECSPESRHIVLDGEGLRVALMVDAVGDVVTVEEATFAPSPETLRGAPRDLLLGAHKLAGALLLLLDVASVLRVAAASSPPSTGTT
jgi:purine-binding chemotaxis protein CheW